MEQKQAEKKMKSYLKNIKGASKGKKRAKKKLRAMVENDLISIIAKKATNHPSWYTKLGGDLINLNFGIMDSEGTRDDLIVDGHGNKVTTWITTDVVALILLAQPEDSTFRVAAQKIVNELRLVSGANTIYDVDDMIDYLLNLRSVWTPLLQDRRSIRALNMSDPYDVDAWRKYLMMSLGLLGGLGTPSGYDQEFRSNSANIINWLNSVMKSVRFMMPMNFSLFERVQWMFENIFADGTGKKFGTKMFVCKEVPYYTHAAGSTQHTSTVYQICGPAMTLANHKTAVETMIANFTSKPENIAIAGDLMKAYGMASFYDPGEIRFDERVPILYDIRALEQLQNADVAFDARATATYQYDGVNPPIAITQSTTLGLTDSIMFARPTTMQTKFVNTSDNEIQPGETLSLTRLKCSVDIVRASAGSSTITGVNVRSCGTEVLLDYCYITGINPAGFVNWVNKSDYEANPTNMTGLRFLAMWGIDDYGPIVYFPDPSTSAPGTGAWTAAPMFDFSNWALLSMTEEKQLHKTAVLSLLTPSASVVQQAVAKL